MALKKPRTEKTKVTKAEAPAPVEMPKAKDTPETINSAFDAKVAAAKRDHVNHIAALEEDRATALHDV